MKKPIKTKKAKPKSKRINWKKRSQHWESRFWEKQREVSFVSDFGGRVDHFTKHYRKSLDFLHTEIVRKLDMILLLLPEHLGSYDAKILEMVKEHLAERENGSARK